MPSFVRFLPIAALFNGQTINISSLSRDAGVPRTTIQGYLDILHETLMIFFLPAYTPKIRVKEVQHPKIYWFDNGVVRSIKKNFGKVQIEEMGFLFEGFIAQTLRATNDYYDLFDDWYYWSTHTSQGNVEVDFLLKRNREWIAIEVKSSSRMKEELLKGLRAIKELSGIRRRILVYRGNESHKFKEGIEVFKLEDFLKIILKL